MPPNQRALVLPPPMDVFCVVKLTEHVTADTGIFAEARARLLLGTALPPITVALPLMKDTAIKGACPRVAPTPVLGWVRAALDEDPTLRSSLDDGLLDAVASPAEVIETANAHPVNAATRRLVRPVI
jgi:hypothetical protein